VPILKQRGRELSAALDARLNALAALEPPPLSLKIQQALAISVPMQTSLIASVAVHALIIVGVGFKVIDPNSLASPHNVLDVVLVNSKSANRPQKVDALAQANLDGGGNVDDKRRAKSPFPNLEQHAAADPAAQARERVRQLEIERQELMTQARAQAKVPQIEMRERLSTTPNPSTTVDLVQKSLEIARLEAQIDREFEAYQQRPKRKFIGARTAEYRFAQYVDNWRLKIERIGNLNYPQEAKARRIYGTLQLTVAIKASGEVEDIQMNRSSGYKVLDQAAIRIVRLAAPFDAFPDNIRHDTDILHITRTWSFTKQDQLSAE
jgi:periplasmic protein TonB